MVAVVRHATASFDLTQVDDPLSVLGEIRICAVRIAAERYLVVLGTGSTRTVAPTAGRSVTTAPGRFGPDS